MIVSHKHKFIFIKTKKTAGTSIEIALSSICGEEDILTPMNAEDEKLRFQLTGKKAQNYKIPFSKYSFKDWLRSIKNFKSRQYYNHIPAAELRSYLDQNTWEHYYKFAFDRHPLNKSISHFKWRGKKANYSSFEEYLNSDDVNIIKGAIFYRDSRGNLMVDKIYKMENLELAFEDISRQLDLNDNALKAPDFSTKSSKGINEVDPKEIERKYGDKLRKIFHEEYKEYSI